MNNIIFFTITKYEIFCMIRIRLYANSQIIAINSYLCTTNGYIDLGTPWNLHEFLVKIGYIEVINGVSTEININVLSFLFLD
jgi:hypothetical protein